MWYVLANSSMRKEKTLVTLGDAIASFLENRDIHTEHMHNVAKADAERGKYDFWESKLPFEWTSQPCDRKRWSQSVSRTRFYGTFGA